MPAERQQVEEAIHTAERILDSINETIRENENTERLAVISKDLFVGQGYVSPLSSRVSYLRPTARHLDLTARTKYMGKRKLIREGELVKAKSGRKLHAILCNDVLILTDEAAHSLYRMV